MTSQRLERPERVEPRVRAARLGPAVKQALAARRLVVILDGFDEGAGTKPAVFGLVKALAAGGHSFLLTSRPEGFSDLPEAAAFADAFLFQMDLLPLSKEQQRLVLQQQMDH